MGNVKIAKKAKINVNVINCPGYNAHASVESEEQIENDLTTAFG